MKKKNIIILLLLVFGLINITIGVSLALFNYTKTGSNNILAVGRIYFNSIEGTKINLTNAYPVRSTELENNPNVASITLTLKGDTTNNQGIEYLISSVDVTNELNGKSVPISTNIVVNNLGTSDNNYFDNRGGSTAIYKVLSNGIIAENEQLLVGYIPNNQGGINGTITIKSFIDADKISIGNVSNNIENMEELTLAEWNSFHTTGISFKIKVEANEGIWVKETLYDIIKKQAVMDNISSTFVSASTGINFGMISSDTNGKGLYIRKGTENNSYPIMYYRGNINNNYVLLGNFCWKIVRTTDTGGIKLVYNGMNKGTENSPNCANNGTDSEIIVNMNDTDLVAFRFSGENLYKSLAYVGYMWGTVYEWTQSAPGASIYFGNDVVYNNNAYTLTDAKVGTDATHHYTCNLTTSNGTCSSVRYYYYGDYYITLENGEKVEDALRKMQDNITNSNAKTAIDLWYSNNMLIFTNYLEDTIWCNDRSISSYGGWDKNGGSIYTELHFFPEDRVYTTFTPSLNCTNKNDRFTVNNEHGNKKLDYPVAMLTSDEAMLAGAVADTESNFYLNNSTYYWLMSPRYIFAYSSREFSVYSTGILGRNNGVDNRLGLRPSISLKKDIEINKGNGTANNPYVIKIN